MTTRRPIVVAFSTAEPRPTTLSSPIVVFSRTNAWSPMTTLAPSRTPASTTACAQIADPGPTTSGGGGSRVAVERRDSFGGLPSTAPSWTTQSSPTTVPGWMTTWAPSVTESGSSTPSPSTRPGARSDSRMPLPAGPVERLLRGLEHPHDAQAAAPVRARRRAGAHTVEEVLALDPQRLAVGQARAVDVPGTGDVLAVAVGRLVEALVVDG